MFCFFDGVHNYELTENLFLDTHPLPNSIETEKLNYFYREAVLQVSHLFSICSGHQLYCNFLIVAYFNF